MTAKEGLAKYERINKDKDIETLFDKGVGFSSYPYRVIYLFHDCGDHPVTVRLLVSVSKKRFHHAFKRNRVKRLIREAWRKNKITLYNICQKDNISVDVALVYTATVIHSFDEMFNKTKKAIHEIEKAFEKRHKTAR